MSSAIASIQYVSKTQTLTITFVRGGTVTYEEVPPNVVKNFKRASSQGRYYNRNIKGQY